MKSYYSKLLTILILFLFLTTTVTAQKVTGLWAKVTKEKVSNSAKSLRKSEPIKAAFYQLDLDKLKLQLKNAPVRGESIKVSNVVIEFPNAEGELVSYSVKEAPVMVPEFQVKHPEMRSYVGQGIDNPASLIRFSITPQGLHTMSLNTKQGAQYIDPYTKNGKHYIVYNKRDLPILKDSFICEAINENSREQSDNVQEFARNADDGKMRSYRIAIASTIEYSEFHWEAAGLLPGDTEATKKIAVLDAMMTTMTRVNGIFERDLSITMPMVDNDAIIFIDSDSFNNNNTGILINQSQTVINAAIGAANYDIGHTFSTGAGGLAGSPVVCNDSSKARGVTGISSPVGDSYDVDYVSHEIGHQFGANHTFNGNQGECSGSNRNASTAYEPGSGSTILGYAGICSSDNVQTFSDAYFHQASINEIWAYITTDPNGDCANAGAISTGNSAPTAEAGASYNIPISTPYKLTGSSTDPDLNGDNAHTYTWEQYDLGAAGAPTEFSMDGPVVRSFEGTTNPVRYIPRLADIISNGGVSTSWEKLLIAGRDLNFELTVRDNHMDGGQTDSDGMIVTTSTAAGPFLVTSQDVANTIIWLPNTTEEVTWDVANTDIGTVDTDFVNILLSTDGGVTFPNVLASNTPNDGMQNITVPTSLQAENCRVMVEGAGNIFFAINSEFFAVGNYSYEPGDVCVDYVFNGGIAIPENAINYAGVTLNIPDSETISDIKINVNISHNDNADLYYAYRAPFEADGLHELASGICTGEADVDLTFDDEGSVIDCSSTNNGDNVIPETALSLMDGENSAGDWVFLLTDVNVGDSNTATWNSTTITICHIESVLTLGIDDVATSFESTFSIYPNPNSGSFNIKIDSPISNKINVSVYDIRGRSIFNNSYNNSSNFNQTINLNNPQSGMYLVRVNDGERSTTKKIIVK